MVWTSAVCSGERFDGTMYLGVIVKRAYRMGPRGLEPSDAAPVIHREAVTRPCGDDALLQHDSDLLCFDKALTDVIVLGSAHSSRPVTSLDTGVCVGGLRREVRVTGKRCLRVRADGVLSATPAESFRSMPLGWEHAYGGRDVDAERRLGFDADGARCALETLDAEASERVGAISDPRNRHGRGFCLDVERRRLDGMELPTQSDPGDAGGLERLLARSPLDWALRPVPAGYGPIDPLTFPRIAHAGVWPASDKGMPEPGSVDPLFANCAALGMASRLEGGERVSLRHLHRRSDLVELELPRQRPRLLIEPPNTRTFELCAKLDTVLLEPDEDRVTLTWSGAMDVGGVFPEALCEEVRHAAIWN